MKIINHDGGAIIGKRSYAVWRRSASRPGQYIVRMNGARVYAVMDDFGNLRGVAK